MAGPSVLQRGNEGIGDRLQGFVAINALGDQVSEGCRDRCLAGLLTLASNIGLGYRLALRIPILPR